MGMGICLILGGFQQMEHGWEVCMSAGMMNIISRYGSNAEKRVGLPDHLLELQSLFPTAKAP